jgi:hypothetical protein
MNETVADHVVNVLYPYEVIPLVCVPESYYFFGFEKTPSFIGIHITDTISFLKWNGDTHQYIGASSNDPVCHLSSYEWQLFVEKIDTDGLTYGEELLDLLYNPRIHEDPIFLTIRPHLKASLNWKFFRRTLDNIMPYFDTNERLFRLLQMQLAIIGQWGFTIEAIDPDGWLKSTIDEKERHCDLLYDHCVHLLDIVPLSKGTNTKRLKEADKIILRERIRLC